MPLSPLLGVWRGPGEGEYPTISNFSYTEELTFRHAGKPFLAMAQHTADRSTGEPAHSEAGYLRALPGNALELVLAQPSGITEVDVGQAKSTDDGVMIELKSTHIGLTPTAKSVTAVRRRLTVAADTLVSELWMSAVGVAELTLHVRSELSRQTAD